MNKLQRLLQLFSKDELAGFSAHCSGLNNLAGNLIVHEIGNPGETEDEKRTALGISGKTYPKVCTQARNLVLAELSKNTETPFDNIYVIQKLILGGERVLAQKLINEQEKELESKHLWLQLEVLYIEASRIHYTGGNLDASLALGKKREKNSIRLAKYVQLNSRIVTEMIRLEGFKNRKPEEKKYSETLARLKKEAIALDHHVLIHNTLHLDYMYTSRFLQDPHRVHRIVRDMEHNAKKHHAIMNPLSRAVVKNTVLNFLTIYSGFGNPESYVRELKKNIDHAGAAAKANMSYAMLEYYLYEENIPKVIEWLAELAKSEDTSKYRQYRHIVFAIKAFIASDAPAFREHFQSFYSDPSHLDFPDMEVNLRLMELIMLSRGKDEYLFESKISALKKYMSRNVNKERYGQEREILNLVEKNSLTEKNRTALKSLTKSNYRNIVFLAKRLESVI
jgi:hypothetical protein